MPGFRPAQGPNYIQHGVPSSAFSRGDVLVLTSASSLSRWDELGLGPVYGIALADSINSIRNRVPVDIPMADSVYISAVTPGSTFTEGEKFDIIQDANGRSIVNNSQNTLRVVVVRAQGGLPYGGVPDQSVESRILVKFLRQGDSVSSVVLG